MRSGCILCKSSPGNSVDQTVQIFMQTWRPVDVLRCSEFLVAPGKSHQRNDLRCKLLCRCAPRVQVSMTKCFLYEILYRTRLRTKIRSCLLQVNLPGPKMRPAHSCRRCTNACLDGTRSSCCQKPNCSCAAALLRCCSCLLADCCSSAGKERRQESSH